MNTFDVPTLETPKIEPWPETVQGDLLLTDIAKLLRRFVVLPKWAEENLALWVLHTYAFHLRDVTSYIGVESPEKRCGKTTLLTVLSELVNRPVVASNISASAFFRVIEEIRPTLLIDEADTFLQGNDEMRGILNSGYHRKTAFVVRVTNELRNGENSKLQTSNAKETSNAEDEAEARRMSLLTSTPTRLARFSCWCPKAVAAIGRLPETLADRCIVLRMQRKTAAEECERVRNLETNAIKRQCVRFVVDNVEAIASAHPEIPEGLNDRAADIWEPLFTLADLAGGVWPQASREAALALTSAASDSNSISSLLLDIAVGFVLAKGDRIFSRGMAEHLNARSAHRPWAERRNGKPITELWLSQQVRPYGIRPRTLWIGEEQGKGYYRSDFEQVFQRYIPKSEARAYLEELGRKPEGGKADTNCTNFREVGKERGGKILRQRAQRGGAANQL